MTDPAVEMWQAAHDNWTPNVEAAAHHAAHHAVDPLPDSYGITAADVDFDSNPPVCPGCERRHCLTCAFRRVFGKDPA